MADRVRDTYSAIASMDEWQRLRLWWHWMIDRGAASAAWHPSARNRIHDRIGLKEFFEPDSWGHVNGPDWTPAHEYFKNEWST